MNMVRRKWSLALAVVLLVALIAVPAMANLDGYVWNDVNGNGVLDKDANNNPLESVIPWLRADGGGFELKYWKSSTCGTGTPVVEYWDTYVNPANGAISVHVPLPNAGTATWCYELRQIDKPGWVRTKPVSPDYYTGTFTGNNPQVTKTQFGNQEISIPVPEFPTIAVSILTISGMFIAVQFIKKRN